MVLRAESGRSAQVGLAVRWAPMNEVVTSPHNPRVRALIALRDRREREATGRILVEGGRRSRTGAPLRRRCRDVFVADGGCRSEACAEAVALAQEHGVEVIRLGDRAFERAAFGDRLKACSRSPFRLR